MTTPTTNFNQQPINTQMQYADLQQAQTILTQQMADPPRYHVVHMQTTKIFSVNTTTGETDWRLVPNYGDWRQVGFLGPVATAITWALNNAP
jgi:hypothetical protein